MQPLRVPLYRPVGASPSQKHRTPSKGPSHSLEPISSSRGVSAALFKKSLNDIYSVNQARIGNFNMAAIGGSSPTAKINGVVVQLDPKVVRGAENLRLPAVNAQMLQSESMEYLMGPTTKESS